MSRTLAVLSSAAALATVLGVAFVPAQTSAQSNPTGMPTALNVNVTNTPLPVQGTVSLINQTTDPVPVSIVDAGDRLTHVGATPSDHVVLSWIAIGQQTACGSTHKELRRLHPDGGFDSAAFVVPSGHSLVVTDVDVVIVAGTGLTFPVGRVVQGAVMMSGLFNSSLVPHTTSGVTITDPNMGAVAISSNLGSGVVVAADQQICLRGDVRSSDTGYIFKDVATGIVRGYVIPNS